MSFRVDWHLDDGRRLSQALAIRYSSLLRRFLLRFEDGSEREFGLRNALLAAIENATLEWPASLCQPACSGRVRMQLEVSSLPAALRLWAWLDRGWRLDSGWQRSRP